MKKFFKFGCLGLIALIVLIVIIAVAGGGDSTEEASKEPQTNEASNTGSTEKIDSDTKDGVLTKEKFEQIKDGMTYEEVVAIVGAEGTVISETGEPGTDFHTVMYEFETDGFLSSSTMMFQGGKLINKAQIGLGDGSDIEITLDQFNQIQNGMTYEEVTNILGGEGEILSESGEKGTDFHTVIYMYQGKGDLGANANLMFQGNKLQNKSQFGLK